MERARMVFVIAWATMLIMTPFMALLIMARPVSFERRATIIVVVNLLGLAALALNRRGHVRGAGVLLVSGLVVLATALALTGGGIAAQGVVLFIPIVLMTGLLLGERAGVVAGVGCFGIGLGLVVIEAAGLLPRSRNVQTPVTLWLLSGLYLGLAIALQRLATQAVGGALKRTETALQERDRSVRLLGERVKELRLLHTTSRLLHGGRPLDLALLTELVPNLPPAWQYPEICEARIQLGAMEASTPGFQDSPWRLTQTFGAGDHAGVIDIVYLEERSGESAEGPFLAEERSLLQSLAELIETRAEQQRAAEAEARLAEHLQVAREEERRALAMDIHDEVGGGLSGVQMALARLERDTGASLPELRLGVVRGQLDEVIGVVRRLAREIRPSALDEYGLVAAIEDLVQETRQRGTLDVDLRLSGAEWAELAPERGIHVYRVLQEALTNAAKHANSRSAQVRVAGREDVIEFAVQDRGQGLPPGSLRKGTLGLINMQQRALILGGSLQILTPPGGGTEVLLRVPHTGGGRP
jgi:signal transduction histidine kinase